MITAFDYLKKKGLGITWNWDSFVAQEHFYAFTSAKITRIDVLESMKSALVKAEQGSLTKAQTKQLIANHLKSAGLWGKVFVENPETKKLRYVNTGSPWRVETIVQTNLQSALMSRKWQTQQSLKSSRPYLQYRTAGDSLVRPTHRFFNKKVYHIDDPIWRRIYPPNGYNCRCDTKQLTEAQAKRIGTSTFDTIPKGFPDKGFDINVGISRNSVFTALSKRSAKLPTKPRNELLSSVIVSSAIVDYLATIAEEKFMTKNYFIGYVPPFIAKKSGMDDLSIVGTNTLLTKKLSIDSIKKIPPSIWTSRKFYLRGSVLLIVVTIDGEEKIITVKKTPLESRITNIQDYDADLLLEATKL